MDLQMLGLIVYAVIAICAAVLTFGEQQQIGQMSLSKRTIGFVACLVWPVLFVVIGFAVLRAKASS
jgi:lipopolysaccharide export LptBFGC system permease protein LptF